MNRNELKNQIKMKAMNDFKDIQLDISTIQIDEPAFESSNSFSFKRGLSITFASLFIFFLSFVIYNSTFGDGFTDATPLNSETEVLGFQTVSSAALLSSYDLEPLSNTEDDLIFSQLSSNTFDITDELEIITEYMNLAETVLGSSSNYIYNEIESDDLNYTYSFEYKGMDFAGNLIEYVGYYNETLDSFNNTTVEGILVNNEKVYNFTSETINNSGVLTYKYTIMINQRNYVEVTSSNEDNVQEFSYKVYKANSLFNSSVLRIYENKNDLEAEIIITNKNNKEYSLKLNNLNDNNGFKVQYNYNNTIQGEFDVLLVFDNTSQENKFQFVFGDNTFITNRIIKGNKAANDNDFLNGQSDEQTSEIDTSDKPRRNKAINTSPDITYNI